FNLDRKAARINVFELGRVFLRDPAVRNTDTTVAGFDQPMRVAGLAYGPREALQWSLSDKGVDFFDLKGDVQALLAPLQPVFTPASHPAMHPGRCASVSIAGQGIGFIGELHPRWRQAYELAQAPMLFELELDALLQRPVPVFQPVSKLQPVERDIAVIVAEAVTHAALMAAIHGADTGGLLKSATLFDVYRPQQGNTAMQLGEKSLAVRLVLGGGDATLTDEQIEAVTQAVLSSLQARVQARLRA
ncbi:MAG: phenylalanine--tRNA ligase subunit beta, partial [Polaromonas sp.]|nr:phenylalanine--tRNA ligase subunit beta [Polaromonas sp.]